MNDQATKSENKFLGSILIFSITIVTWMIFIPELQTPLDKTFYNINDHADSQFILADASINDLKNITNK